MRTALRVVLAEDSVLLREGLASLLGEYGHRVVAAVGDGPSLVDAIVAERPDISIVDVRMPPRQRDDGLRAALAARAQVAGTPVLILSQYVELAYAHDLLADRAGGTGYLLKNRVARIPDFLDAVGGVAAGGTVLDPDVVAQMMVRRRRLDPLGSLTPRERDVLGLMAQGKSNTAIGKLLGVSESAIEKHVSGVFLKFELHPDEDQHRRVLAVLQYLREAGTP